MQGSSLARVFVRPTTMGEVIVASFLFYNPLITAVMIAVLGGGEHPVRSWLRTIAIADTCTIQCVVAVVIAKRVDAWIRTRRGQAPIQRSMMWSFSLSTLAMPFSLPAGFIVGGWVSEALGIGFVVPDLASYRTGLGIGLLVSGAFFIHRSRLEAKDRIRELEHKQLEAKLAALTAEMNPHLLFNALNTVASLIHKNPERAEQTVLELAELYRGILRASGASTHPLADELRLCEAYLAVEKARFGDRLAVQIDVSGDLGAHVPVLVLQPFVENAVKHGIAQRKSGGTVWLRVRTAGGRILAHVDDDGVGIGHSSAHGAGRALENCRERLRLTYGDAARIELSKRDGGGTRVAIELPVRLGE